MVCEFIDMNINKYTKDFMSAEFPGWQVPRQQWDYDKFWYRKDIPWVEVPLNLKTDLSYHQVKSQHKELFTEVSEQQNMKLDAIKKDESWFFTHHQHGWEHCVILRTFYPQQASQIKNTKYPEQQVKPVWHKHICNDLIDQLHNLGIEIQWVDVKALLPGGWIQPHRDPKSAGTSTLEYFWIPLNDCSPNIKIWPAGYVKQRTGNMYLVNNQHFLHAVVNQDPFIRYVLTGRINKDSLSSNVRQLLFSAFTNQWCDQSHEIESL
jgi:hypothetical protein